MELLEVFRIDYVVALVFTNIELIPFPQYSVWAILKLKILNSVLFTIATPTESTKISDEGCYFSIFL